jgi:hypothetical protein
MTIDPQGDLFMFWTQHADAVGAGLVVAALALLIGAWLDRPRRRKVRALRGVNRALIHHSRSVALHKARRAGREAAARAAAFDCAATEAIAVARPPVRTALMEASGDLTMETRNPYAPLPYDGTAVTR